MSRYSYTPTRKVPGLTLSEDNVTVIVGWDNPLQTLFGDVEVDGQELPTISTMAGMGETNIKTVDDLEYLIGYRIPGDVAARLIIDMDNRTEPSPLQKSMASFLTPRAS